MTLLPPPDSPKIVTFAGSPPNFAMLSRTHSSAATMSSMPTLPESANSSPRCDTSRKPEHAEPVVDADDDHVVVAREVGEVVQRPRRRPDRHAAAVQPHEHRTRRAVTGTGVHTLSTRQSSPVRRSWFHTPMSVSISAGSSWPVISRDRDLRARRPVLEAVAHAGPCAAAVGAGGSDLRRSCRPRRECP